MIKPIDLEELESVPAVPGPTAAATVARLTDPAKRRLVWYLQWRSHQDGGLKRFAFTLLFSGMKRFGSPRMHAIGFQPTTFFCGEEFDELCNELRYYPPGSKRALTTELLKCDSPSFLELVDDVSDADRAKTKRRAIEREKERTKIMDRIEHRRISAASMLIHCRSLALELPQVLVRLCSDPSASWDLLYFRDLIGALDAARSAQSETAATSAAPTRILGVVENALGFAHRTQSLVVIKGTERIGKTAAARRWVAQNPDKARFVSLTAATTDFLFYREIADALGVAGRGATTNDLRGAIRDTVQNRDITLVFDEAHCLFGLSHKASIKRLEYIRTEFVNRGVPIALIITPQFASRLGELESQTNFNINQFRGRVSRWVELETKLSRTDIELVARFCLPGAAAHVYELLTSFGLQSEYPLAAVTQAITEARELAGADAAPTAEMVKKAIGFALFTASQVATTLPRPEVAKSRRKQKNRPADAAWLAMQPACSTVEESQNGSGRADAHSFRSQIAPVTANPVLTI